ncbi:MAG: cytochrome c3 family protein [Phycisphaerae bacterium]|nr:cytochrome c3 family protein [Phycisphaerae bacterium]
MFTRKFDRKVHVAFGVFLFSLLFGVGFGYYVLWPSDLEAGYEPAQPILYSHKLHAGDMKMQCLYCHSQADKTAQATTPPVSTCMNCHSQVQSKGPDGQVLPATQFVLDHWKSREPIRWNKVSDLADFVYFDHSRHVNSGLTCQECHGPIETMDRVRRQYGLKMSWCLACHRQAPPAGSRAERLGWDQRAPINCSTCHR